MTDAMSTSARLHQAEHDRDLAAAVEPMPDTTTKGTWRHVFCPTQEDL